MSNRQDLGRAGEEVALGFLSAQGWQCVGRRVRSRYGEIDLAGEEEDELVFVEVKTRASVRCGAPEEAWTKEKRRRLWKTAACLLASRPGVRFRFDLVVVRVGKGEISVRRYRNVLGRWA